MKRILTTIWQFPQMIVGWGMLLFLPAMAKIEYNGKTVTYSERMQGGISLGNNIILSARYYREGVGNTVKHEYGHSRQSMYLGWLYLLVIGLPSLIWAAIYTGEAKGYYRFYTEKWADKLGNVIR